MEYRRLYKQQSNPESSTDRSVIYKTQVRGRNVLHQLVIIFILLISLVIIYFKIYSNSNYSTISEFHGKLRENSKTKDDELTNTIPLQSQIEQSMNNVQHKNHIVIANNFNEMIKLKDEVTSHTTIQSTVLPQHDLVTQKLSKKRIAYAITVTKDGPFIDGALVLGYSALKIHDIRKGYNSTYEADLIAFIAPGVIRAKDILMKHGWIILDRNLPVELEEIENKAYAKVVKDSGCCGVSEFLKLWSYSLVDYHRVVHLDMDSVIYRNMDELYSLDKELLYTGDWNMRGSSPVPPAQGGFLVVRPSMDRFEELRRVIRTGDWRSNGGWGGSGIGNFWGGQTIQGILPYFYYSIHPGEAMELNRCIYNCMVDNPYRPHADDNVKVCLDKTKKTCQDCRLQESELVSSAHFTICQKPWTCEDHVNRRNQRLCKALHEKWFSLRAEFEQEIGIDISYREKQSRHTGSRGMCKRFGHGGYLPIPIV